MVLISDIQFGQGNGAVAGKGPEDPPCAQLRAHDAGSEGDEEHKCQAECASCALRGLAE